ncbi:MAG: M28 family peptidase [Phycisphaerales bacterium]
MKAIVTSLCLLAASSVFAAPPPQELSMSRFVPERREAQLAFERKLLEGIDAARLRTWHELVASEPHVAGTPGDLRTIDKLATAFADMGLEVQTHWVWPYLAKPVGAELEIIAPPTAARKLGLSEPPIPGDDYTRSPDLIPLAWNAYSGSGDVTGPVVYANYGTKSDFAKLKELGIDVKGAIVLARYGGNFRGFKAMFAEEAGAAGLLIFTDPEDSGFQRGPAYPEGGWATPTQVQCGSILTGLAGDPLTPMIEATENAPRITAEEAGLPVIPVQPISWESAQPILKAMTGEPVADRVPEWQGGLPTPYRLYGGADLRVRLKVEQSRQITKTANVLATLKGAKEPEKKIIIGCHHDAWNHGACDPTCGLILVLEAARVFSDLAKAGSPPDRSIVFAAWGAEEFGILGSVEWVEGNRDDLEKNGVAYINLDMATMGPNFYASATPTLRSLIYDSAKAVPNAPLVNHTRRKPPTAEEMKSPGTVYESWAKRSASAPAPGSPPASAEATLPEPPIGDLGGGSDHIGFVCHVLVPSISLGSGGAPGTSYHSIYDTLDWYRAVVGDDYLPAQMNARMTALITARLANADVLPLDPRRVAPDFRKQIDRLSKKAEARKLTLDSAAFEPALTQLEAASTALHQSIEEVVNADVAARAQRAVALNAILHDTDRVWKLPDGAPGRAWFRNAYAASDRDSGYAPWILPLLEAAVEDGDQAAIGMGKSVYLKMLHAIVDLVPGHE